MWFQKSLIAVTAFGPKPTSSHVLECCGAARRTGLSLRLRDLSASELTMCGLSCLLLVQLMLTQKIFACAAALIRQCNGFHQTSHSMGSEPVESKPPIPLRAGSTNQSRTLPPLATFALMSGSAFVRNKGALHFHAKRALVYIRPRVVCRCAAISVGETLRQQV